MTDLLELFRTVWRHPVVALLMVVNVMAITAVYVAVQSPMYESTITLQIAADGTDTSFLAQINSLTPLYSALLSSPQTLAVAQTDLGSTHLAQISVLTFTDSPVLKVNAISGSANAASASAGAVIQALNERLNGSKLGAPGISVAVIDGPSPADMSWPRPALTLGVAAIVGVLLAVLAAWIVDTRRRKVGPASVRASGLTTPPLHAPTRRPEAMAFPRPGAEPSRLGQRPHAGGPATFTLSDMAGSGTASHDGGTPAGTDVGSPSGDVGDATTG